MEYEIVNACIVAENRTIPNGSIVVKDGIISSVNAGGPPPGKRIRLNLNGLYVYPGLINGHDHLLSSYLPRVAPNKPYLNWLPWDNDLKSSIVFSERQQLDPEQLYLLGAYKNIVSGATSVQDHIPHFVQDPFVASSPVRILNRYSLSHSICTYSLNWGEGPKEEYAKALQENIPYITRIAEGFDSESRNSLKILDQMGCLGEHTVLVHGVVLSESDIELIARKRAHLVWCPEANLYLYERTVDIRDVLKKGINVSLGTDSNICGSLNLLEEIRAARNFYQSEYGEDLSPRTLFEMVTSNPAKAFRVNEELGSIAEGKKADLVVISRNSEEPFLNLCESDWNSIRLVVKDGVPVYGDAGLQSFFEESGAPVEEIKIDGIDKYLIGTPAALLESLVLSLGYKKDLAFFPAQKEFDNFE
ncbi:hydrolase [Leptospira gomenensis]|uniref:Hydrolase n=1 Tax=Leptospira gomenensis TaxID=2484974 RepID=A0A5F1Y997_9LEPT|nr:amidohydrolase family protein [Leptospira gomenensis]TGK32682.1 hydrolase [Leptospira gomenensis]TGK36830.1 hydrolase [Leptospira gomenensis]TGK39905.1 hydrolase [Leptospira gomenensis]TGK58040.1 hydrolase [Leptospira gomenensis]